MGMSTHIIGYSPPDEKWEAMSDIYYACKKAGVDIPEEVAEFFDYRAPDSVGVEVDLVAKRWNDEHREGFELNVDEIPKHVKVIRFYNSW